MPDSNQLVIDGLLDSPPEGSGPHVYEPPSRSLEMYRVAGHWYPLKRVPQCKVCASDMRREIEERLIVGHSYASIAREYSEYDLTANSVWRHFKRGHMPLAQAMRRAEIEARADEIGRSVVDAQGFLVDQIGLLRAMVQQAWEDLAAGRLRVSAREAVRASMALIEHEQFAGSEVDHDAWREGFEVFLAQAEAFMPADQWTAFVAAINDHPVIRRMLHESEVAPVDYTDADVIEEPRAIEGGGSD